MRLGEVSHLVMAFLHQERTVFPATRAAFEQEARDALKTVKPGRRGVKTLYEILDEYLDLKQERKEREDRRTCFKYINPPPMRCMRHVSAHHEHLRVDCFLRANVAEPKGEARQALARLRFSLGFSSHVWYCCCRQDPVAAQQVDRIMADMKSLLDDYKLLRSVRRGHLVFPCAAACPANMLTCESRPLSGSATLCASCHRVMTLTFIAEFCCVLSFTDTPSHLFSGATDVANKSAQPAPSQANSQVRSAAGLSAATNQIGATPETCR